MEDVYVCIPCIYSRVAQGKRPNFALLIFIHSLQAADIYMIGVWVYMQVSGNFVVTNSCPGSNIREKDVRGERKLRGNRNYFWTQ